MDEHRPDQPRHEREQEAGTRGGEAAFAYPAAGGEVVTAWATSIVRWSPIWMGLLAAIGIYFAISALGFAIALSSADVTAGAPLARDILQTTAIWNVIAGLVALFVGGFLAGRLGVHTGLRNAWTQGTAVWALYLIVTLLAAALGLSGLAGGGLGALGDIRAMTAGAEVDAATVRNAVESAALGAWLLFAGIVISWLAAVGGAWLGVKSAGDEGQTT